MIAAYRFQLDRSEFLATEKSMAVAVAKDDMKMRGTLLACAVVATGIAMALFRSSLPGLLVVLLLFVLISSAWRRSDRQLKFAAVRETEVTFDTDGAEERGVNGSKLRPWSSLRRIHDLPAIVILEFAGWEHVTLPNESGQTLRNVLTFLNRFAPMRLVCFQTSKDCVSRQAMSF